MASIEITEIESQLEHRLLFNMRLSGDAGRFDFPIGILDRGSGAANETAVLNVALGVAEQLAKTLRDRLAARPAG
jgi:hypothetical protein